MLCPPTKTTTDITDIIIYQFKEQLMQLQKTIQQVDTPLQLCIHICIRQRPYPHSILQLHQFRHFAFHIYLKGPVEEKKLQRNQPTQKVKATDLFLGDICVLQLHVVLICIVCDYLNYGYVLFQKIIYERFSIVTIAYIFFQITTHLYMCFLNHVYFIFIYLHPHVLI